MSSYVEALRFEGYVSLRDQYLADMATFPGLNQRAANQSSAENGKDIDELAANFNLDEEFDFGGEDQVTLKDQSRKEAELPPTGAGSQVSSSQPAGTPGPVQKPAPAPQRQKRSPSIEPTKNLEQVRTSVEKPILEFIINSKEVGDQQVKDFALHALMCKDVVLYEDPETKILKPVESSPGKLLSRCRKEGNPKNSQKKGKRLGKVEMRIWSELKNTSIQQQFQSNLEEASSTTKKGGARLFSESQVDKTENQESKLQRVVSPPKV